MLKKPVGVSPPSLVQEGLRHLYKQPWHKSFVIIQNLREQSCLILVRNSKRQLTYLVLNLKNIRIILKPFLAIQFVS